MGSFKIKITFDCGDELTYLHKVTMICGLSDILKTTFFNSYAKYLNEIKEIRYLKHSPPDVEPDGEPARLRHLIWFETFSQFKFLKDRAALLLVGHKRGLLVKSAFSSILFSKRKRKTCN